MNKPIVRNPRKPNGDLGDLDCSVCKGKSGAYLLLTEVELDEPCNTIGDLMYPTPIFFVCRKCLESWVDAINEEILNSCKKRY